MCPAIPAIAWLSVTSPGAATIRPLSFSASPASFGKRIFAAGGGIHGESRRLPD
jgi:hypothetical protein